MNDKARSSSLQPISTPQSQRLWVGALLALCAFAYLPAWLSFFVKDDIILVTSAQLDAFAVLQHSWPGGFFRPTAELLFAVQHMFFGLAPLPYHLVSFTAHIGSVYFAYRLFNLLPQFHPIAPLAAGLFALHPLNTETVSWISGQMSLFSSLCILTTLYFLATTRHRLALIPIFILGLGLYENFLLILVLWAALCIYDGRFRAALSPTSLIPLLCCSAAYLYWRFIVLNIGSGNYQTALDPVTSAANITYYLYLLAGGTAMGGRILYYRPEEIPTQLFEVFTPLLILNGLLALTYTLYKLKKRERLDLNTLLPFIWIALALLPAFLLSERPRRLAYIAVPGFSLIIAQTFMYLQDKTRLGARTAKTGFVMYLLVLAATLHLRNYNWQTAGALERVLPEIVDPGCQTLVFDVPNLLGDALFFNSISAGKWLNMNGVVPAVTIFTPFAPARINYPLESGCYYRYANGTVQPVHKANPDAIFFRGQNWAATR